MPMKPTPQRTVYQPFGALGQRLPATPPDGERKPAPEKLPDLKDERALLAWAMRDVAPLPASAERVDGRATPQRPVVDEDEEAYAELKALVEGRVRFNLSDGDEYLEGSVEGMDSRILSKLRRGSFAIQDYLDLHGRTRAEAKEELTRFIERSGGAGKRSVLVVHGRGLNSKDQQPVLKQSVAQWLVRGKLARWTLCFCTARSVDGGAGAMYVLLRNRPAQR